MPWKVVSILWPVMVAALLPLDLNHALARLPAIVTRLAKLGSENRRCADNDRSRPHQVDDFRARFVDPTQEAA